jgi:hypothetical protein
MNGTEAREGLRISFYLAVLRIRIRIHIRFRRIRMFLGLLDPDPDLLVRGMAPGKTLISIA